VKLARLEVDGFGKLSGRTIEFDPDFNVVYGPNEAGKSTLSAALLASLYGFARGEKDAWRPWSGARYAAALTYRLGDGRTFEVRRDFERDGKGVQVYDEHGNDVSAECANGKNVAPGYAHLGLPLEVFVNASFVGQGDVAIDGARAERITHTLTRALDGGPKEDAALGAMGRLDAALATHVGRKRATVNAPLRRLRDELALAETRAAEMRERLQALAELRARVDAETQRAHGLEAALLEHDRRGRALRAHALRSRLDALREIRDELSALAATRAQYDDVNDFPSYVIGELEERYRDWYALDALARTHAEDAARARLPQALLAELEERRADGGALSDDAFAELESAAAAAVAARDASTLAANEAQSARRSIEGGAELFGVAFTAGAFVALGAGILALFRDWLLAAGVAAVALVLFGFAWTRWRRRRRAARTLERMQAAADSASSAEKEAAGRVAAVLGPLGVSSVEELAKRRNRARELGDRKADAQRRAERAAQTRDEAARAAAAFDDLAVRIVTPTGSRQADLARAKEREARKSARDGIDLRLSMLEVRRSDVLGDDDEFALETELGELGPAGLLPAPGEGLSLRAFEAQRGDLERRARDARSAAAAAGAELRSAESNVGDLAALDEQALALRTEVERLERFEAALELAMTTIDDRTRESHQKFARRLADYASGAFADVTAGRYVDVRVDPTTLAVNVRVPETGGIVSLDRLSAGTREQAYLVVRLAMARMFSEGLETAPLLLDDPFAYWDEERIERCFGVLASFAKNAQIVLFTTSKDLAEAAAARGARRIDLAVGAPASIAPSGAR
jgi:DNA repair exonuclease SbcCD ATPase subunit